MAKRTFKLEGKVVTLDDKLSKADIARRLLDEGISLTAISKAVPMSYSQVHSINKKLKPGPVDAHGPTTKASNDRWARAGKEARERSGLQNVCRPEIDYHIRGHSEDCLQGKIEANKRKAKAIANPKARKGIGKLRTPGMPTDIPTGPCVNCGHDTALRRDPTGFMLIHVNTTAEEYVSTIQFCKAVPEALLA